MFKRERYHNALRCFETSIELGGDFADLEEQVEMCKYEMR